MTRSLTKLNCISRWSRLVATALAPAYLLALLPTLLPALANAAPAPNCSAQAEAKTTVVELYTSEGCSSCPPADRWLSTLKGRPDVIALAFHVNYWDRLGWPDRFATAATTDRQRAVMAGSGSPYVYTPQVIVNGADWRGWPKLPAAGGAAPAQATTPAPTLSLSRSGKVVSAEIGPGAGRLGGYWALVEDGHASNVRAGENRGETLRHDHVVRRYEPVPAWTADTNKLVQWTVEEPVAAGRRVVFVLTPSGTSQPLRAASLAC